METCWNVTLPDSSPLIKYSPYADGDKLGWTGVYAGGEQVQNGVLMGLGDSEHVTGGQSEAQIVFNGTAIYLEGGTMGNMQYEVVLDGKVTPGRQNGAFLATFTKLSNQEHNLILRAKPQASDAWLGLKSAIVTVGTGLTGASSAQSIKEEDDAAWAWGPGFTETRNPVTGTGMKRSTTAGDWAALTFSGHSVIIHGMKGVDHGQYMVSLDGRSQVFNATSRVTVGDTVLFAQSGMNNLKTHVLNITQLDDRALDLDYAEVVTVQGGTQYDPAKANANATTTSSGPPMAAIIGGVVGGLLFILLGIFLFWFSRRRRNQKQASTEEGGIAPPPPAADWKPEMTMAAPAPVVVKPPSGPRVRFGELAKPGSEDMPYSERSESPAPLRPMPSILRRQESATSVTGLLQPGRMRPADEVSIASSNYSATRPSISSMAVEATDSQRSSAISTPPVRPPRPPQDLFVPGEATIKFPEPDLSFAQPSAGSEPDPAENPFASRAPSPDEHEQPRESRFSDSTVSMPNPFDDTPSSESPSPNPDKPTDLKVQTENIPEPAPEQRSAGQATRDLLAALETDAAVTISRSGTRKVGLPSNPRAGFNRQ